MQVCESCHQAEAVVHLTEVAGEEVLTVHLCTRCAAERGVVSDAVNAETPLGSYLASLGKGGAPLAAAASPGNACPSCGATLDDIRASLRTGCAQCWVTFERPLRDLVRRLHGATRHTGRIPVVLLTSLSDPPTPESQRSLLQEELRVAIEGEWFERAAELRDQLGRVEPS